jgi:hypothetical protein
MGATAVEPRRARRSAQRGGRRVASVVGGSRAARVVARGGLVVRTVFYLLLAALIVRVAFDGSSDGHQTNAHGALTTIAEQPLGWALIAAAALGFLVLGVVRIAGAVRDRDADARQRLLTGAQGVFYAALTYVPLSFVLGSRSTGSERAQRSQTATVLGWPGGRALIAAAGLVVIGVCAYQIRTALRQDFTDGLQLRSAPGWVCRLVELAGSVGIAARALVFLPIGLLLIVAAVQSDPAHAVGLDRELATLAHQSWWGPGLLGVVALGLLVFAVYSGLEARYRRISRSA